MRYLMEHFDKKRYQCWFLNYPSGMRLERVARATAAGLKLLKQRYAFKECYVVAHSMGGLVARSAIDSEALLSGKNFVSKFITISTPWAVIRLPGPASGI